jgi:Fe-S cluster biosynthesis and repair protein YggX
LPPACTGGITERREKTMANTITCVVTGREGEPLDYQPYPGELGERIQASVTQQGWDKWLAHQTILINEYRLTPFEPKARKFLEEQMEKFFFGDGAETPDAYVPPEQR